MNEAPTRNDLIESKIDRGAAGALPVSQESGGLGLQNMLQVMELAKLMAVSQQAVPAHLRGNPGMCLAVCLTAVEWKMSPFAVANKTYVTNDRLNYESQLLHAVIEARAPLKERLSVRYEGDGEDRVCIVSGTFRGEDAPREHKSPPLKTCRPPRNEYGKTKGSPLWDKKPDVQMFYDTSRDFCRIYCPDVILGIYTPDEVEQYGIGDTAKDITPSPSQALHERLKASASTASGEGFHQEAVENGIAAEPESKPPADEPKPKAKRGKKAAASSEDAGIASNRETAVAGVLVTNAGPGYPLETSIISPSEDTATTEVHSENPAPPNEAMPTTPAEYRTWVSSWLMQFDSAEDIKDRWAAERTLRNACGLTEDTRAPIQVMVEERINQVSQ